MYDILYSTCSEKYVTVLFISYILDYLKLDSSYDRTFPAADDNNAHRPESHYRLHCAGLFQSGLAGRSWRDVDLTGRQPAKGEIGNTTNVILLGIA